MCVPISAIEFDPRLMLPAVTAMNEYPSTMEYSIGPQRVAIAMTVETESEARAKV